MRSRFFRSFGRRAKALVHGVLAIVPLNESRHFHPSYAAYMGGGEVTMEITAGPVTGVFSLTTIQALTTTGTYTLRFNRTFDAQLYGAGAGQNGEVGEPDDGTADGGDGGASAASVVAGIVRLEGGRDFTLVVGNVHAGLGSLGAGTEMSLFDTVTSTYVLRLKGGGGINTGQVTNDQTGSAVAGRLGGGGGAPGDGGVADDGSAGARNPGGAESGGGGGDKDGGGGGTNSTPITEGGFGSQTGFAGSGGGGAGGQGIHITGVLGYFGGGGGGGGAPDGNFGVGGPSVFAVIQKLAA